MHNSDKEQGTIGADQWIPLFMERIHSGQKLKLAPIGYSMYPFLISRRDYVILKSVSMPLKRGDICLYRREDGVYILHTLYRVDGEAYYFLGDSQTVVEGPIALEQILAVADTIIRKEKEIACDNKRYRFLHELWMKLRILRPLLIRIWLLSRTITGEEKKDRQAKEEWKKNNK